ncbi:MAG TPA: DNA-processing protein DprA [Actinomycetota bacterium]
MSGPELRSIDPGDPAFPGRLRGREPGVERLWVAGADPHALGPMIAVVGARRATAYGLDVARGLAADLAAMGFCIASGMALGIDRAAHEGALAVGGATLAVLASGADRPTPSSNKALYERILHAGGSIVSEYPPGTDSHAHHFPARNRIIAWLSLGTLVVQGRSKSGARITAGHADVVFAVPGDIRSPLSELPHELLADGARLCAGAGDVVGEFGPQLGWLKPDANSRPVPPLPPEQRALVDALAGGPASLDALVARTGMQIGAASIALTSLEVAGVVVRAPGGRLQLARS